MARAKDPAYTLAKYLALVGLILGALLLVAAVFFGLAMLILYAGAELRRIRYLEVLALMLLSAAVPLSLLLSIALFRRREW